MFIDEHHRPSISLDTNIGKNPHARPTPSRPQGLHAGYPPEFEAMKAQLRLAPSSSSPHGKPSVVVTAKKAPKHPIHAPASISHSPTELEQLLGLPFVPRSHR